ncbi:unnamed protein product [Pleuronectes platessa]|uniref:Uncharacterized protein n=1 Tax=Pleuronectes platessa TaxID=8262 RepID=A0A9N7UNZ5_PLEPL|nr:unnamed protein product [Pleuronectes platessa]
MLPPSGHNDLQGAVSLQQVPIDSRDAGASFIKRSRRKRSASVCDSHVLRRFGNLESSREEEFVLGIKMWMKKEPGCIVMSLQATSKPVKRKGNERRERKEGGEVGPTKVNEVEKKRRRGREEVEEGKRRRGGGKRRRGGVEEKKRRRGREEEE